ncbi:DinB family protein [Parapedobacter sp. ISTM3]|uniref:DinB family protein n=1 Tax=Parapedobacter sp. ISTM3 TaxID=2800130 RepID=UPI001905BB6E|nr:DinB family protein [Parapedobacter sp. ISTM3]MBK1441464.1 DinB family protein [Parapedobacter sp. ISTM3]
MDRKSIIQQYWQFAAEKEGWYPPYADALRDVDASLASWRPEGVAANTIWETVAHVIYFKERLIRRIKGFADQPLSGNDETFVVKGSGEAAWQDAVAKLFDTHRTLGRLLQDMEDGDLDTPAPSEPIGAQFLDLTVHDAYHTGQIIFIRKLKGAWPSHRSFS